LVHPCEILLKVTQIQWCCPHEHYSLTTRAQLLRSNCSRSMP
jgi:hypothetical protein